MIPDLGESQFLLRLEAQQEAVALGKPPYRTYSRHSLAKLRRKICRSQARKSTSVIPQKSGNPCTETERGHRLARMEVQLYRACQINLAE